MRAFLQTVQTPGGLLRFACLPKTMQGWLISYLYVYLAEGPGPEGTDIYIWSGAHHKTYQVFSIPLKDARFYSHGIDGNSFLFLHRFHDCINLINAAIFLQKQKARE